MSRHTTQQLITALYPRLSHDDDMTNRRKAKLFFSASIGDAVFALLDSPDKFVVDGNALFLTLAAASHTRRFINRNPVNQFVKHEAVEFFKAGVFSDKGCEAVNIGFGIPNLFQRLFHLCNVRFQRCPFRIVVRNKHGKDVGGQLAAHVILVGAFQLHIQVSQPFLCRCKVALHRRGLLLLVGAFQFHEPLCGFFSVLREEEVHDESGVGIGLYLAREIITRQGGYIKVISEIGKGSTFSVFLPVR